MGTINETFYLNWKKYFLYIWQVDFETLSLKEPIFKYFPTSFHPNQAIRTFAIWRII